MVRQRLKILVAQTSQRKLWLVDVTRETLQSDSVHSPVIPTGSVEITDTSTEESAGPVSTEPGGDMTALQRSTRVARPPARYEEQIWLL